MFVHNMFVHNFGAPLPPTAKQQSDGFPLDFVLKGPQTELLGLPSLQKCVHDFFL